MGNQSAYMVPPKDGVSFVLNQPTDTLLRICSYLPPKSVLDLGVSASKLHNTISQSKDLWNFFLQRDFFTQENDENNTNNDVQIFQRDLSKDVDTPKDQYSRLVLLHSATWKPNLLKGHIVADHYIIQNNLKSSKGTRVPSKNQQKGPMTISLLFLGMEGAGISSLIQYILTKYPYFPHIPTEGTSPTAASGWYKNYCIAMQRCSSSEVSRLMNTTAPLEGGREDRGVLTDRFFDYVSRCEERCNGDDQVMKGLVDQYFIVRATEAEVDFRNSLGDNFNYRDYCCNPILGMEGLPISTIVVVVDSSQSNLPSFSLLSEYLITKINKNNNIVPNLLVLAHKQDKFDCVSIKEIHESLKLDTKQLVNWAILPTSLKIKGSVEAALDWIVTYSRKFDSTAYLKGRRTNCCVVF